MAVIISLINVKGGVGKTLTTINLAGQMAKHKHKTLVIDNDSQGNASQILNVHNQFTMYDLYDNPKVNFSDCITKYNNYIDVIPNTIESAILESKLHNKMTREVILKNKYQNFENDYDFILIDNSPFLGIMTTNAMSMSDYYIEVIDNSPSALQGLNMVNRLVEELKYNGVNDRIKLLGILRNRFEKKSLFSRQFTEVTEEELQDNLFTTIIYDSVKYKEAGAMHTTIQEYSKSHAEPYKELYYETIQRIKNNAN